MTGDAEVVLRVHLTGRLSIETAAAVVGVEGFRGRQGRIAFAYLALSHDRSVARSELAEALWPDRLPRSWESDLSAIVSRLRGTISKAGLDGTSTIVSAQGSYELTASDGSVWVDVEDAGLQLASGERALAAGRTADAIAQASSAREVARRPFLPGDDSVWLESVRSDLREIEIAANAVLADAWAEQGDTRPAVEASEEEIRLDPIRESAYRRLMKLHASSGDRGQALRAWERCKQMLAAELGVDPSDETQEVYSELIRTPSRPTGTAAQGETVSPNGIVTFLFTDMVDSTSLLALGEDRADEVRRTHFRILRDSLATRGGQEVKNLGDGLMVVFGSVREAIGCAISMQQAVERHNQRAAVRLGVRIGLNAGEPIRDQEDYFGSAVVVARRLCDASSGGQILASEVVRGLSGDHGSVFVDAGERTLKGIDSAVQTYEIAWDAHSEEPVDLPSPLKPPAEPLFSGRDNEMAWLAERFREACSGELRVALVPGDPGIGKTRLVSEFAVSVHGDSSVLYGRCDEEAVAAYQPIVEALDRYCEAAPLEDVRRHIGRGASDLAILLPSVARRLPSLPPPISGDPESERFRLFDAVSSFLASLAEERAVLFVLEDVHWSDRPTLMLLRHLARQAKGSRILLLATVRDIEVTLRHPLSTLVDDLRRDDQISTLKLDGLGAVAVGAMVTSLTGSSSPELLRSVIRVTEGNPLFVRELARHVAESGDTSSILPEGIKALIGRRIDRLGEEVLEVLALASVVGRDFDLDVVAGIAGRTEGATLDLLDLAVEAHVIDEVSGTSDRYTFTHALIRETLYERLSNNRRRRVHVIVAEVLRKNRATDLEPYLGELAYHYAQAGRGHEERAYTFALKAAERSEEQLAYEEAADHFDLALRMHETIDPLDHQTRIERLMDLGYARQRSGESETSNAAFYDVIALSRKHGLARPLCQAVLRMTDTWTETGLVDSERLALLEEALANTDGDPSLKAQVLGRMASALHHDPSTHRRRADLAEEGVVLAEATGDERTTANALDAFLFATWSPDSPATMIEHGRRIAELGEKAQDLKLVLTGLNWQEMGHLQLAQIEEADEAFARYERTAEELRQPRYLWYVGTRKARRLIDAGNLVAGDKAAREAYEAGRAIGESDATYVFHGQTGAIWRELGKEEDLARTLQIARECEEALGEDPRNSTLLWWRYEIFLLFHEEDVTDEMRAETELLKSTSFGSIPRDFHWLDVTGKAALFTARVGDEEAARIAYELLLPYRGQLRSAGGTLIHGCVDEALAHLSSTCGDFDSSVTHFEDAIALYERIQTPLYCARTRHDLAVHLRSTGVPAHGGKADALDADAMLACDQHGFSHLKEKIAAAH